MEYKVTISTKGSLLSGKGSEIINDALTSIITESMELLLKNVKRLTPRGVYGAQGKGLLGSIQGEVIGRGTPLVMGQVASSNKYAEVIEKGRAPGKKWPPEGSLLRWIQVKMNMWGKTQHIKSRKKLSPAAMAKSLEFVIRRKIGQKGFEGAWMFKKGLEVSMPVMDRIRAKIEGTIVGRLNK
jgi:hypothetical protein